jgi:hypothetical protein
MILGRGRAVVSSVKRTLILVGPDYRLRFGGSIAIDSRCAS